MTAERTVNDYLETAGKKPSATYTIGEMTDLLRLHKIEFDKDVRRLANPSELARDPSWQSRDWVVCHNCRFAIAPESAKVAYRLPGTQILTVSHIASKPDSALMRAYCPRCDPQDSLAYVRSFRTSEATAQNSNHSHAALMIKSVGIEPEHDPRPARALAHMYGMLPIEIEAILNGESVPEPAEPRVCDMAQSRCQSFCAERQREGLSDSPFTMDGRPESCQYREFLLSGLTEINLADQNPDSTPAERDEKTVRIFEEIKSAGASQQSLL